MFTISNPLSVFHYSTFKHYFLPFVMNNFLDIIGAVDEIGYTQPHAGSKKIQVNLKLKDVRYEQLLSLFCVQSYLMEGKLKYLVGKDFVMKMTFMMEMLSNLLSLILKIVGELI
jgi:hypothetical protein